MLIAIMDMTSAPGDRARALAQLDAEAEEVRAMPGNVGFRAFADRDDDTALTVLHEWADEESFAGYLDSDAFARFRQVIRPLMTSAPVSRRFHAELLQTVR